MRSPDGMRVGYVLKRYPRLSETFILDEILGVEAAGVELSIFSLRPPDDGTFHADLARVRARARYLPGVGSRSTLEAFDVVRRLGGRAELDRVLAFTASLPPPEAVGLIVQALHLADLAVREQLTHLHAHFMTLAAHAAYLAHVLTGIPFTVTAHAKDIYADTVERTSFAEVATAATAIVTVCEANRRHIARELVDDPPRIEVIYNGIDLERMPIATSSPRGGLVLAAGRLVEKKGFDVLLEACRILVDRGVDLRCVVLGDGPQRNRLLDERGRLDLDDTVEFAGAVPRDEILRWMTRARVLAAPCLTAADGDRDALPTVLLEALALGLPVVTTSVTGIPEIVDDGVQGLVVGERDASALADAIQRLLVDGGLWSRISAAGLPKVRERFSRDRNIGRLIELFGAPSSVPDAAPPDLDAVEVVA